MYVPFEVLNIVLWKSVLLMTNKKCRPSSHANNSWNYLHFHKKNSKYIYPKKTCLLTLATLQTKSLWTQALDLGTTYDILMLHAIYLNSKKNCYLYKFENDILHCLVLSLAWYGLQFCPWSLIVILQRQKMRKKCGKSMIPQQRGEMTCNWKLSSPESSFCLLAACERV